MKVTLAVVFWLLASSALAQEPSEIQPLEEGDQAPFSGMLFPTETAVRWRFRIEGLEARLTLDVSRAEEIGRIRVEALQETRRVEAEQAAADVASLREALRAAQNVEWYEHPTFWLSSGLVLGIVCSVFIAILAN